MHVLFRFTAGSVVWAKASGWPAWPGMVDDDPDTGYNTSLHSVPCTLHSYIVKDFFCFRGFLLDGWEQREV